MHEANADKMRPFVGSTRWEFDKQNSGYYYFKRGIVMLTWWAGRWHLYVRTGRCSVWVSVTEMEAMVLLQSSAEEALAFYCTRNPEWKPA